VNELDTRRLEEWAGRIVGQPVKVRTVALESADGVATWEDDGRYVWLSDALAGKSWAWANYVFLHECGHHVRNHVASPGHKARGQTANAMLRRDGPSRDALRRRRRMSNSVEADCDAWVVQNAHKWLPALLAGKVASIAADELLQSAVGGELECVLDELGEVMDKLEQGR